MKNFSPEKITNFIFPRLNPWQIFSKILPSPEAFVNDWGFPGENYTPKYPPRTLLDCQNFPQWPEQASPGHLDRGAFAFPVFDKITNLDICMIYIYDIKPCEIFTCINILAVPHNILLRSDVTNGLRRQKLSPNKTHFGPLSFLKQINKVIFVRITGIRK